MIVHSPARAFRAMRLGVRRLIPVLHKADGEGADIDFRNALIKALDDTIGTHTHRHCSECYNGEIQHALIVTLANLIFEARPILTVS